MVLEFWCFQRLGAEIARNLQGQRIRRAWKDGQEIGIQASGAGFLRIRCGADGVFLWDAAKPPRAPAVPGGGLRYLPGSRVVRVETHLRDRMLSIHLEREDPQGKPTYGALHLEWLPRRLAAVLVSLRTGLVLDAWGAAKADTAKKRMVAGQPYRALEPQPRLLPGEDGAELFASHPKAKGPLGQVLEKSLVGCGRGEGGALAAALGWGADDEFEAIPPNEKERLWAACESHYAAALTQAREMQGEVALRRDEHKGRWGADINVRAGDRLCASMSLAVEFILRESEELQQVEGRSRRVRQGLQRRRKAHERRLKALRADLDEANDADALERQGHSLLAAVDQIASGAEKAEIEDVYGGGAFCIKLDPRLAPAANAARMLKRARRYRRRLEVLPARLAAEEAQLAELGRWSETLEREPERADEIAQSLGEGRMEKQEQRRGDKKQAHPRRYTTTTGWSVWAGRNNRENDIVSHRLAAQNDYWFHAHGYAGSHVILRREGRKEEPDRQTLEEAAAVAAFWSKGKTAKKVAVIYTLAKFVSKPRGGAPGLAAVRREKTLMVKPTLLREEDT